ncbi:MAG: hypothetical protein ACRD07_06955 [Acidimicrobiales bacterium]
MRRAHHRSFMLVTAVLATAATFLAGAGCRGRSTGDPSAAGPIAPMSGRVDRATLLRVLALTRAVESGRVEVTTVLTHLGDQPDPPPGGRLTVARHRVAFDRRAGRVAVETDMSGAAGAPGGRDAAAGGDLSVPARMVAADDVVYAQGGPMAAAVGRAPADWVEIDRAAFVDRWPSSDAAALLLDPLGPFEVLGDTTVDARVVGHDVIRGSPVTHLATSADSAGGPASQVDVSIDADGVIRRLEVSLAGGAGGGAGRVVTTVELFDVGRAVDITPPRGER